jgi:NAD(P)-dependent dehydrogenase (short-subunit alcohol dehydrogenase family)
LERHILRRDVHTYCSHQYSPSYVQLFPSIFLSTILSLRLINYDEPNIAEYIMSERGNSSNTNGKVAVITGSSKGIGKAIAMEFAKAGYSVVLNARNEVELKRSANDISKSIKDSNRVISIPGDISKEDVCISLVETAIKQFGRIDVMVNKAGISGESKKIHEMTERDWDEVIDVSLKGTFLCTREAVKKMIKNKSTGQGRTNNYSIINISSVHEQTPQPESAQYAASKGGMELFTKTAALELADKGIRVNGVAPGAIATDMNDISILQETHRSFLIGVHVGSPAALT